MANARTKAGCPGYQIDRESLALEYGSVNKRFLIKRGWTRTAIKRILGEPDRRLPMRMFRQDRPECRYEMKRVLEAEAAGVVRFRKAPERAVPTWRDFLEHGGCDPELVTMGLMNREETDDDADTLE